MIIVFYKYFKKGQKKHWEVKTEFERINIESSNFRVDCNWIFLDIGFFKQLRIWNQLGIQEYEAVSTYRI